MTTPAWLGATAAYPSYAGQINQFLGGHASTWRYTGNTLISAQATGTGVYETTASQYWAQSFTTGSSQTALGQLGLQVSTVGGSPITPTISPLQLSLYADIGGPSGSPLATVSVGEPYVYSASFWVAVPLSATGLTSSTRYWMVTSPVGIGTAYYVWQKSNQPSGASLSTDGVTYTPQTFGLMYQVYDQSGSGQLTQFYEDNGARITLLTYDSQGRVSTITEYVTTQGGSVLTSARTLTYSGTYLTGVS